MILEAGRRDISAILAMVLTRSETKIAQIMAGIDDKAIHAFAFPPPYPRPNSKSQSKSVEVVARYLREIDRAHGKEAKTQITNRLFEYLARPKSCSLFSSKSFALVTLLKLAECDNDPIFQTSGKHVDAIYKQRGMLEHVAFYRHPTALKSVVLLRTAPKSLVVPKDPPPLLLF
uniref:Uncharacterized protein n=1 Tax=Marseillevirus LCMAC103 TaxID=2506604 RepID=A0A481YWK9_9VIRU|nr:MAG: hypothetical protein LCMAC103_02440 [Marseillevirus LCMAC103]